MLDGLATISHPVTIAAASYQGRRSCATSTTMYVGISPPMVAIGEHRGSTTGSLIRAGGQFSLSILAADQLDLAERAGRPGKTADKLAELAIPTVPAPEGFEAPGVAGSLAVLWCEMLACHPHGDDLLIVGEVVERRLGEADAPPLVRHRRRYRGGGAWLTEPVIGGYPL